MVWLGIAIFGASLTGCIWLIIVSARYDDVRIPTAHQVFGVPDATIHRIMVEKPAQSR